jgi:glycosyltransferase involved in cell wall biosynthesis
MPVKNAMPYLTECIDSILCQSHHLWELIAVNDHSDDGSAELLKQSAQNHGRIKVLDNPGKGIIDALRTAYRHSTGHMITRMDADDIMHTDKLTILVDKLNRHGRGHLAIGQVQYFSEKGIGDGYKKYEAWLNGLTMTGNNFDDLYRECVIPSPCWMLWREDLEDIGAFDSDIYPEDYDLAFRMYHRGLICIPCQNKIHKWRDHSSRSSRNDDNYSDNRFLNLKVHYFLSHDYDSNRPLVIWGAGKKGKQIVQTIDNHIRNIHWICDNPNKIGHNIHGHVLASTDLLLKVDNPQIIIAVANAAEQIKIEQLLLDQGRVTMKDFYFFC